MNNSITINELANIYKNDYENNSGRGKKYPSSTTARWVFGLDYSDEIIALSHNDISQSIITNTCNQIIYKAIGKTDATCNMQKIVIASYYSKANKTH